MRPTQPGAMRTVACLSDPKYTFCTGDDADAVRQHFGDKVKGDYAEYDSFFVHAENGQYVEVWGMNGIVPYLSNLVCRLI